MGKEEERGMEKNVRRKEARSAGGKRGLSSCD